MNKITIHCDEKHWPEHPVAICGMRTETSSHRVVGRRDFDDYRCSKWEVKCKDCERLAG